MPRNEIIGNLLKHRPIYIKLKPFVPGFMRSSVNRMRNRNLEKAPPLDSDMREFIAGMYADDIESLQNLIDRDLSIWTKR